MIRLLLLTAWLVLQSAPLAEEDATAVSVWPCSGCELQVLEEAGTAIVRDERRPQHCVEATLQRSAAELEFGPDSEIAATWSDGHRSDPVAGASLDTGEPAKGGFSRVRATRRDAHHGCSAAPVTRRERRAGISACRYTDGEIRCVIL